LAGKNEVTINEENRQRFSSMQKLWHVELPEMLALEGQPIDDAVMVCHWRRRYMPQTHPDAPLSLTHNDNQHIIQLHHETFQNTIVASASFSAVLFNTGKPYTFGLNHHGQCGIGSFTPNVWTPSPVVGLASL
jgi:hypothetical protein